MDFSAMLPKMSSLLILLFCGYILAKLKLVNAAFNRVLSKLTMNFFMCATIIYSVANNNSDFGSQEVVLSIIAMTVMMLICMAVGLVACIGSKGSRSDKNLQIFTATFMNAAFIGYPIVQMVYGDDALFFASMVQIPFNIFIYTYGVALLKCGGGNESLKFKSIVTAPMVATLTAVALFALDIQLPDVIVSTIGTVSDATVPLSMICVGISLSEISIKDTFTDLRIYFISFIRLIAAPLLTWLVLSAFIQDKYIVGITVIEAATPVAVACSVMAIDNGKGGAFTSKVILLSTLLSMITIPLIVFITS